MMLDLVAVPCSYITLVSRRAKTSVKELSSRNKTYSSSSSPVLPSRFGHMIPSSLMMFTHHASRAAVTVESPYSVRGFFLTAASTTAMNDSQRRRISSLASRASSIPICLSWDLKSAVNLYTLRRKLSHLSILQVESEGRESPSLWEWTQRPQSQRENAHSTQPFFRILAALRVPRPAFNAARKSVKISWELSVRMYSKRTVLKSPPTGFLSSLSSLK